MLANQPNGPRRMPNTSRRFLLLGLLCALLAGMLLWPGRGGGFLLDDEPTISENHAVQITDLRADSLMQAAYAFTAGGGSRALPMLTFGLDHWRAGLDPAAFKATNIAIHALTTAALACFFRLLLVLAGWSPKRAAYAAPALALAWAIHPLQASSVLYVVQRMQTMGTLFLVLALWSYLKMRQAQMGGERSRQYAALTGLSWALALASKEDSVMLPAYTLAMELTVLQFRAAQSGLSLTLRRGYMLLTVVGVAAFAFAVLPHYWSWEAYRYRDFSSSERLMTQARVLAMYIGQIVLPAPGRMPFYYDDLIISRGLLQPATTLPAIVLVCGLLLLAWCLRLRRPLFALGVFLFFAGHFITSNIVNLELAFEHRNHFPLIGATLAVGDLMAGAYTRLRMQPRSIVAIVIAALIGLGSATFLRVQTWSTPLGLAQRSVQIAPRSERAWVTLCRINFDQSAGRPESPHFHDAIDACQKGASLPRGATNMISLIVLKSIQGTAAPMDWENLRQRLQRGTMTPSDIGMAWYLVRYSNHDARIDARNVVSIIDIVGRRNGYRPHEYAGFGYYAAKKGLDADAYRYFTQAVMASPPGGALPAALIADLKAEGRVGWADKLETLARDSGKLHANP